MRSPLTLGRAFVLSLTGVAVAVALLFSVLLRGWEASILASAEAFRSAITTDLARRAESDLRQAEAVVEDLAVAIRSGVVRTRDAASLEAGLFSVMLSGEALAEATFTAANAADDEPAQVSVFRVAGGAGPGRIVTRRTRRAGGSFVAESRVRPPGGGLLGASFAREPGAVPDPAAHDTFRGVSSDASTGPLWTDLHHSQLDAARPERERRVVVSVLKAVTGERGSLTGVLRVSRSVEGVHRLVEEESRRNAPHELLICDERGRLVTRGRGDPLAEEPDESLRIPRTGLPPPILRVLDHPARDASSPAGGQGDFVVEGRRYLVSFRRLERTQDWRVAVVVPEEHYLGDLAAARGRLVRLSLAVLGGVLVLGTLTVRAVRRGLAQIVDAAGRMRRFDFRPRPARSPFRDVAEVTGSLERAKTALRAMGKYVPVDLVRQLYEEGREPVLGGHLAEVSLMFTDIRDFTALAEALPPDDLARALGHYLEAMTGAVHESGGVVDKYIGDAVMALWNVPRPSAGHARQACRAALACQRATEALYGSPAWAGLPPLVTRIGLHTDRVLVGHFGAPDRMSFTAMGDGVNLAARLEGLNKSYGTTILASEAVEQETGDEFAFRLVDVVAVKGKTRPVRVHELLGPGGEAGRRADLARAYRRAFEAYLARDFQEAARLAETLAEDGPSRVLLARCRHLLRDPPPPDWDGVFVSTAK